MKTKVNTMVAMVLVLIGAAAQADNSNFAQSQLGAIEEQQDLIRAGVAAGSIDKDLCIYFVGSLQDMAKSAYAVTAAIGGESSQLSKIASVKLMSVDECK